MNIYFANCGLPYYIGQTIKERGLKITLVKAAPHILSPFDTDIIITAKKN